MAVEIRRIAVDDVELYRDLRTTAVHDTPLVFGETPEAQLAKTIEQWRERVELLATHPTEGMFLALDDGRAIGLMGAYYEDEDDDWVLISVWVAEPYRGTTVTTSLHTTVIDWARSAGAEEIYLEVVSDNARAIAFYNRIGYRATGVTKIHGLYTDQTEVEMVLRLA